MLAIVMSRYEDIKERIEKMVEGIEVVECSNFLDTVTTISQRQNECTIVFADYDIEPYSGIELLRAAKKIKRTVRTVLMISREDEEGEVEGLRSDIDLVMDYEKRDIVNRAYIERLLEQRVEETVYVRGMELIVNGGIVELSRIDAQIISLLMERSNEVVRREEILERVWGQSNESVRKVGMHVRAIRKRLEDEGVSKCIVTVSGEGYKWVYS